MLRRLAVPMVLCIATLAAAEEEAPLPETKALLAVAADAGSNWQARAAALRVLAKTESVPSAPLVALARDAQPGALRRLALTALIATAKDDELVGAAVTHALADKAAGVRREALIGVAARPAACTTTLDAVIALLSDEEALLRAHAARAVAALANENVSVRSAADALLPLLADEDTGPLAARALVAARPDQSSLAQHDEALRALVRARGGPVPAALVLSAWAGRRGEMWERTLRAFAGTGSPRVSQAAFTAIAATNLSRTSDRTTFLPAGSMQALRGPDPLIVATALRLHASMSHHREFMRRIPLGEQLKRHESKLVRTLATRLLADEDQ